MFTPKWINIHGFRDERWTTKDKIHQYRSVLKLRARDKQHRIEETGKLRQKVSKELDSLTADVKQYRVIIGEINEGDKFRLRTTLQQHRAFKLAYYSRPPQVAIEAVHQDCDLQRRQLDKLYYERKKRAKEFINLQVERCDLLHKLEEDEIQRELDPVEQKITARIQKWTAKQTAAKMIRTGYMSMLTLLKKDAAFYDALLRALQEEQVDQCKIMVSVTVMGQLTAEKLDDARTLYNRLSRDILYHMRIREQTLAQAREEVEDVWAYAQSLVRVESDPTLTKRLTRPRELSIGSADHQIKYLEEIFDKVKESLLVRSYHEIFPRLEEQLRQRTRLLAQFEYNLQERDMFLFKKQQALEELASLEHTMVENTGQYKTDKKAMLEELAIQEKRLVDLKDLRKARGELLMKIRAALQNMITILIFVRRGKGIRKAPRESEKKMSKELDDKDDKEEGSEVPEVADEGPALEPIESDGLVLLSKVSRKVGTLFGMSSFELDQEREEKARDLYQSYVADYRSQVTFGAEELEPTGLFVEHEVIDSSVLTRDDIKLRSKQIIEANTKVE